MSVGVKVTERVSVPAAGMLPAAGVYTNVPGTDAVALSCVEESVVPKVIFAGLFQVITGVAWEGIFVDDDSGGDDF